MANEPGPVTLPHSEQFYLYPEQGRKYLIQLSWPLHWQDRRPVDDVAVPVMYIVDGNALFLTATETAWRRAVSPRFGQGGIVVAIGYSLQGKMYDGQRRAFDLTPPSASAGPEFGGADLFLNFIDGSVRPAVRERLPNLSVSREALYGHSYGGLFALHALFSRPRSFECYMASSPSIWWDNQRILHEAKTFLDQQPAPEEVTPSLMISWGTDEQDPPQRRGETLEEYEARNDLWKGLRMRDNARDLCERLDGCEQLHMVFTDEYAQEEHLSVMACSLNRDLTAFFEDWPLCPP